MLDFGAAAMDLNQLSDGDQVLVDHFLRAAADRPFFPEWEFQTLFGLSRKRSPRCS